MKIIDKTLPGSVKPYIAMQKEKPKQMEIGKLESIQALRGIAFLGIFLLHAQFFIEWAGLSVSVFFVLSGFLLIYLHGCYDSEKRILFKDSLKYAICKIKPLYPLHIITMLMMLALSIVKYVYHGENIWKYLLLIAEAVLNIFLVQTWFPFNEVVYSLNGVAWYLAVCVFLYFMYPYISRWISDKKKRTLFDVLCADINF